MGRALTPQGAFCRPSPLTGKAGAAVHGRPGILTRPGRVDGTGGVTGAVHEVADQAAAALHESAPDVLLEHLVAHTDPRKRRAADRHGKGEA